MFRSVHNSKTLNCASIRSLKQLLPFSVVRSFHQTRLPSVIPDIHLPCTMASSGASSGMRGYGQRGPTPDNQCRCDLKIRLLTAWTRDNPVRRFWSYGQRVHNLTSSSSIQSFLRVRDNTNLCLAVYFGRFVLIEFLKICSSEICVHIHSDTFGFSYIVAILSH